MIRTLIFLFGLYVLVVVASLFAFSGWPISLLVHFQAQFLLAGLGFCLIFLACRNYKFALLSLAVAGAALYRMDLFNETRFATPVTSQGQVIKVAAGNFFGIEAALEGLAKIHAEDPFDLLVLTEIHALSKDALLALFPGMNHLAGAPRQALPGLPSAIVVSRVAPRSAEFIAAGPEDPLAINRVEYCFNDNAACLTLFAVHPYPPFTGRHSLRQIAVFEKLTEELERTDGPILIAGDMNSVSWAPLLQEFHARTAAKRVVCSQRWSPTWLTSIPGFGLELDHFFIKGGLGAVSCDVGPSLGSDHWPILGTFDVPG